jgi:hypothetical protein
MKIYTGYPGGEGKKKEVRRLGLGVMISSCPSKWPGADIREFNCALDNGAFTCYNKGYPFMEKVFLEAIDRAYKHGLILDFIVTPDIICGGKKSLEFSLKWADGRLSTCPSLALVVQDGMEVKDLDHTVMHRFSHIFVGGSVAWKWETAHEWKLHAASYGMKCHIGQCGPLKYLNKAKNLQVDSVDSTSWAVNESWHILDEFMGNTETLFNKAAKREGE